MLASGREFLEQPRRIGFAIFHEGAYISEVRCWLALRASVLRRAVSSAGTAQERRAKVSAGAVSWDFRCTERNRWSSASRRRCRAVPQPASIPHKQTPRKSVAQFKCGASNGFNMPPFLTQGQCWLTLRSTGHFAAHRRWASFHSRPTPVCHKMPVSSNVSRH